MNKLKQIIQNKSIKMNNKKKIKTSNFESKMKLRE